MWVAAKCLPIRGWRAAALKVSFTSCRGQLDAFEAIFQITAPQNNNPDVATDSSQICRFARMRSEKGKKKKKKNVNKPPTRTNINTHLHLSEQRSGSLQKKQRSGCHLEAPVWGRAPASRFSVLYKPYLFCFLVLFFFWKCRPFQTARRAVWSPSAHGSAEHCWYWSDAS